MNLAPCEPLTQVVFIHDYFQLVFQGETLSIYNQASLRHGASVLVSGEPGFCDALVALIDQKAKSAASRPGVLLALEFTSGAELHVHTSSASQGQVEAFIFVSQSGELVVGQNG